MYCVNEKVIFLELLFKNVEEIWFFVDVVICRRIKFFLKEVWMFCKYVKLVEIFININGDFIYVKWNKCFIIYII